MKLTTQLCLIRGTKLKATAPVSQSACFASEIIQLFSTKISGIQFLNSYRSNTSHARKFPALYGTWNSVRRSQEATCGPHPEPDKFSQHPLVLSKIHFNIMLQMVSSLQVFQPKHCKHVPSRPCMLNASPTPSSSI